MTTHSKSLPIWSVALPILAWGLYFFGLKSAILQLSGALLLIGSVLSAVYHAEVVAHKVGEPFGTILLALAITVLEVGLIVSLMVAGGENAAYLARDTVFAAIMLILNGLLGGCLFIGGLRHREQFFGKKSSSTALAVLATILTLSLVLPNFTTSTPGATLSNSQLIFVAVALLVLYGSFIFIQTVRHRDYFLMPSDEPVHHHVPPTNAVTAASFTMLVVCLGVVILMAKALSPSIEFMVDSMGAPHSLVGVIIATVVLLPEVLAALKAAMQNRLQTSINLGLGSALASIGLTIPAVVIVCLLSGINVILGLDAKSMLLLGLSLFITMLCLNHGKTNMLYGVVLLVNLATYVFMVIVP
jgi:calcium/proton antiporter